MNVFEEIKKRLGELQKQSFEAYEIATCTLDQIAFINNANAYANAICIVNEVEEEYKNTEPVNKRVKLMRECAEIGE